MCVNVHICVCVSPGVRSLVIEPELEINIQYIQVNMYVLIYSRESDEET